jgi:hypothetical protein
MADLILCNCVPWLQAKWAAQEHYPRFRFREQWQQAPHAIQVFAG